MTFKDFYNLIGCNISSLLLVLGIDFENKLFYGDFDFYHIKDKNIYKEINGMPFKSLTVLTGEKENIEYISIHFSSIVNRDFYDKLIEEYGNPYEIKIIKKRTIESTDSTEDKIFTQKMTKSEIELTDGTFEQKPLFVNWKKDSNDIQLFFKQKQNTCELIFKKNKH